MTWGGAGPGRGDGPHTPKRDGDGSDDRHNQDARCSGGRGRGDFFSTPVDHGGTRDCSRGRIFNRHPAGGLGGSG